jgi:hypothetical protein
MAARQDQTLHVALIVFAILLVLFAGFMYWFYKQASDTAQQLVAMEQDRNEQRSAAGNRQDEIQFLRKTLGFDEFAERSVVEQQATADMARMGGTLDESKRTYRDVLQLIYEEGQQLAAAQAVDKEKIKDLEVKLQEIEAGHKAQIARLEADKAKIEQDAAAARNQFAQARAKLDASQKKLAEQLQTQAEAFEKTRTELVAAREAAEAESSDRQKTIDKYLAERADEEFSFEVADGEVTWVNQANNTVWINIGSADSLRRQVTFSVYDTEDTDAGKADKKGALEVVRMLGPHMAECRVTDDDPRNPILPGDYIYSPTWHEGRPQHFALTGVIDLDGDGRSDLELAKDLIELNGGVLDAYPNPQTGEQEGEMTIGTRYLVYGDRSEKTNDSAIRKTWDDMHTRADALGVELISLIDFMNQMGYKPEERSVQLGSGTNSNDFRPRPSPTTSDLRPRPRYVTP